jgi:hypothetical protein
MCEVAVNQPPLQHPPVFQLLTDFFGQSGEKFILCAKQFGPSKMKFRGLLALKTWRNFVAEFLASPFIFSAFFEQCSRIFVYMTLSAGL